MADDTDSQRVAELEERVEELEATIEELLPGRRSVLKSAGAVGLLGLGAGGAATASAEVAETHGSASDRIDVYANEVDAELVQADELNSRLVYDTAGNYYGELTGTNDASVVQAAIDERPDGESVVVPDPGFELGLDREIRLPHESNFGLLTVGQPVWVPQSDFDSSTAVDSNNVAAVYKEPGESDRDRAFNYYVGSYRVNDQNHQLDWGHVISDVKNSWVDPIYTEECPGVLLNSENIYSNQNTIRGTKTLSSRGPCVKINNDPDGQWRSDQNRIVFPHFHEGGDAADATETAYIDEGEVNLWIDTRSEICKTTHLMDGADKGGNNGCVQYYVQCGDWDRASHVPGYTTVKDKDGAYGTVTALKSHNEFSTLKTSSATTVESVASRHSTGTLTDMGESIRATTPSSSNQSVGLQHNGTGSATVRPNQYRLLRAETGATSGDSSELTTGGEAFRPINAPRFGLRIEEPSNDQCVIRVGYYGRGGSGLAEWIYDPQDTLGDAHTNWYFAVEAEDGTGRQTFESSVGSSSPYMSVRNHQYREPDHGWSASIGPSRSEVQVADVDGYQFSPFSWRIYVETLEGAAKTVDVYRQAAFTMYHLN